MHDKAIKFFGYKFFDKKSPGTRTSATCTHSETLASQNKFADVTVRSEIMSKQELSEELPKQPLESLKQRKVHSPFKYNICSADQLNLSTFNKGIRFLLCVIDIFSKYAWIIHLKAKKVLQLLMLLKVFR